MRTAIFNITMLTGLAAAVAGCTPHDAGLGENVKRNMAMQIINPDPQYDESGMMPGSSGDRAASAAERYRKGTVKEPVQIRTSTISGVGSGSGSK